MIPGQYDLQLYRGDTFKWIVKLWQDVKQTIPTDLTGATPKAEFRDKTAGTAIAALGCVLALPNTITITMTAAAWATAPANGGIWDLQITMPDASVNTVLKGNVVVIGDVTDSV
jgi:hypothetical protein